MRLDRIIVRIAPSSHRPPRSPAKIPHGARRRAADAARVTTACVRKHACAAAAATAAAAEAAAEAAATVRVAQPRAT